MDHNIHAHELILDLHDCNPDRFAARWVLEFKKQIRYLTDAIHVTINLKTLHNIVYVNLFSWQSFDYMEAEKYAIQFFDAHHSFKTVLER